jgi:ABC-type polysaccharide transport system permease subunit
MDTWNYLEYLAWALSIVVAATMLIDMFKVDTTYDNELLTSSREGEIELTQERHEL